MLKLLGSKCLIVNICIYPELAKDLQKDNQHYLLKLLTHFLWIIWLQIGWHLRNHFPQRDAYDVIRSKWFLPQTIKLLHSFLCNYIFFMKSSYFQFLFVYIHGHKSSRASCLWGGYSMSEVMYLIPCCPAGPVLRQPGHCYVSGETFSTKLGFYSETFQEQPLAI